MKHRAGAQGTHGDILILAVKHQSVAVQSGFASCCVSILASVVLSCHGQGFLPLVLQHRWQWEEGLILAWDRVMDQRTPWGPVHPLPYVTLQQAPFVTYFRFCEWGVLYKSQLLLLFMLFIYWSHFLELGNGKKKSISRFTLFMFNFTISIWGMLVC